MPYKALQVGDLRCNRVTYGLWSADRYLPLLDDEDPRDLRARDVLLSRLPGNLLFAPPVIAALRVVRALLAHPRDIPPSVSWAVRFAARLGRGAFRGDLHATTYVMHSFMDAADVAPAWELLQKGVRATDRVLLATQERLEACAYAMAHPDRGEIVPACVQHSVFDEGENAELGALLPMYSGRDDLPQQSG